MKRCAWLLAILASSVYLSAQSGAPVPAARFAGTWVGTQAWAIDDPPPGARQDQPVTLTIEVQDGTITGSMKPFMGSEEGAAFTGARIDGDQLQVSAVIGRPRGAGRGGPGRSGTNAPRVTFTFRNEGLLLSGTGEVFMGDVPWTKFRYSLEKKRSRY